MAPSREDLIAELAPSGVLRAAINLGNVVLARRGADGPEGVTVDLARELARSLGLAVELVPYAGAGAVIPGQATDRWDVAFLAAEPERAAEITFTAPYVHIDASYLVRLDAPFQSVEDLDAPGVRIAVGKGAAYDLALTRLLRAATLVRAETSPGAIEMFKADGLEAAAGIRQALVDAAEAEAGYRVLPDNFSRVEQAMAVPPGRPLAAAHVAAFIDEKKRDGFLRAALDRHGQTSVAIAGPFVEG